MKNYKIKIVTGFTNEQHYTVDADEAHKAYYLFLNPEQRGIFKNGVALIGKNIQTITPDYNATMGWNATHKLDDYDWEEIHQKGVAEKIEKCLIWGRKVATLFIDKPEVFLKPLDEVIKLLPKNDDDDFGDDVKIIADKFKI